MARIVYSDKIKDSSWDKEQNHWLYNGLDCGITLCVWNKLQEFRNEYSDISYNFVFGMQAPALEMSLRGFNVNRALAAELTYKYESNLRRLQYILNRLAEPVWGKPLNPNSPAQLQNFFYNVMKLPKQIARKKGEKRVATDREALEKLKTYHFAKPIINIILAMRDCTKKLAVLRSGIDSDNRFRSSYNPTGTETGRWSSSENCFGTGTNAQNITDTMRIIFTADAGMKLGYADLEQAESRAVAYISGDKNYINACESGDLHTTVTSMVWKDLPWTGILKQDKEIAEQPFYRHFSYRDMAKRGGHGTNYFGKPHTMAMHLKVESSLMESFQAEYFTAFPGIPNWHGSVATQLQTKGYLITPLMRKRVFFGRLNDDATLREGIAFVPQSTIGEALNLSLWKVWYYLYKKVQCLAQIHDAIVFQFPENTEPEITKEILELMTVRCPVGDSTLVIPSEVQTGWNWSKAKEGNPDGLKKYKGNDERQRTVSADTSLLAVVIR